MFKNLRGVSSLLLLLVVFLSTISFVNGSVSWLNPNQPYTLDCTVDQVYSPSSKQQVTYTWSLNGTIVHSGSEPSYVIATPNSTHVGDWRCQISFVSSGESVLSHRVSLNLAFWQPPDSQAINASTTPVHINYGRTSIVSAPLWTLVSSPSATVEWFDSLESSISLRHRPSQYYITQNGSLIIFDPKHTLTLRAVARNPITIDEFSFFINPLLIEETEQVAGTSNSIFLVTPNDVSATLTDTVTFECIPRSTDVIVEWYRIVPNKDGGFERQDLGKANSMQFQISKNRGIFLTLKYIQLDDTGEYHCVAKGGDFPLSVSREASARLSVLFSPVFPTDAVDREKLIDLDDSMTWPLTAVGSPAPNSSWFFNGRQLIPTFMDPAMALLDSGGLVISHVRLDHAGFYQCIAENSVDETIFTIHVTVRASPPQITSHQSDQTIQSGDSVSFKCKADGAPKPKISWSKNGDRIVSSNHVEVISDEQTLLIKSATVADEGLYTCFAINSRGNASITSSLRVMTKTRIVLPPQNNSAQIGTSVQFYCSIQSDPRSAQLPRVSWYRNRVHVVVSGESRFAVASNNSLLISQIRSDDGGAYECRVESNYGSDSRSATLTVLELPFPPIILSAVPLAPEQPRAVRLLWGPGFDGNSPILNYIVEIKEIRRGGLGLGLASSPSSSSSSSLSSPVVGAYDEEWSEIATFTASSGSPLEGIINNLLPSRTYAFRVRARNSLGAGNPSAPSANVTLPAQPPSGPPQNFVASSPSNSSIIIQWQPPAVEDQNGELSAYRVRYRLSGYNPPVEYRNITDIGSFQRSYQIEGLIPHKQYDVSMAAVNERGVGVFSKDEHVWTRQGRPSVPPSDVDAKASSPTSILVSWTQPDPQKINGILSQYRIFLTRLSITDDVLLTSKPIVIIEPFDAASPATQSRLVENLAKYTNYSIQVAAETEGGLGPVSDPAVYARTEEDLPDAPASLKIVDNIDTSMTAVWSPPDNINGILTQYIVEFGPKASVSSNIQSYRKVMVERDVNNVTLTNLLHDTVYTVSVSASSRKGRGPPKTIDVKSGVKPELADPPVDVDIANDDNNNNVTAESALVTFTPGNDRGSPVFSYAVEALINGAWVGVCNATPFTLPSEDGDKSAINVTNLHPFTIYQLRLFSINAAGKNHKSSPASRSFMTDPSIPGNVRAPVLVRAVNSTTLVVKWSPLNANEWNGSPSHYLVEYRPRGALSYLSLRTSDAAANAIYIADLHPWTFYDIRLTAWNSEVGGSRLPAVAAPWRTWEAAPSAYPALASATAKNSSCISTTWRELANTKEFANGVILGYKVMAQQVTSGKRKVETFYGNKTLSGVVCGLDKYTEYSLSAAAFTRMGHGPFSNVPLFAKTAADFPDPPSCVYFSQIGDTFVEIWWDEPLRKGADEIMSYRLKAIAEKPANDGTAITHEVPGNVRNFTVAGLKKDTQYKFTISARNELGWSLGYATQLVYTFSPTVESTAMMPPTQPLSVSAKPSEPDSNGEYSPASITISWRAPFDAYLPVRNYTLQYQNNQSTVDEPWLTWSEEIAWNATNYVAKKLQPREFYRFRLYATNDAGVGTPSDATAWVQPSQSPPQTAPSSFSVKPVKADSVEIRWDPVDGAEFYDVLYCRLEDFCLETGSFRKKRVAGSYFKSADQLPEYSVVVGNLDVNTDYEFRVDALNKFGVGPETQPPFVLFVGDIVPSVSPVNVQASMDSSTSVNINWKASKELLAIVDSLIGYKVTVSPRFWVSRDPPATFVFSVSTSQSSLRVAGLTKYTQYAVTVAAMSLGGDGPATSPIFFQTPEDVPTAPADAHFTDIMLDSVTFRWSAPLSPNGNITVYEIVVSGRDQQPATIDTTKLKSVKVQVPADQLRYSAQSLVQGALYRFSVRASTSVGFGPFVDADVKTEPPPNAPDRPVNLQAAFLTQAGYVRLTWTNPRPLTFPVDQNSRIIGYLVDVRRVSSFPARDSPPPVVPWIRVFSTDSPYASTQVSLDVLPPGVRGSDVQFRVAARSVVGQSWFSDASPSVYVPRPGELASTDGRPYYLQHWFLGLIALAMLLILTVLVASLVVSGYRRRHRKTTKHHQQRAGVVTGEHRRSSGYGAGMPGSHFFGNGPGVLNPNTASDHAGANGSGPFGVNLRGQRHNMYNSSIHSRTSRSRRPRSPSTAPLRYCGECTEGEDNDEDDYENESLPRRPQSVHKLPVMHVNVAKAHVHVNVLRSSLLRSPPRPSLAGYEPSESAHSASTSVIGAPVSVAPHFSVVPSANAIASELASITGAKQRSLGVAVANSAMDDFSGSQTSSPLDGDDENNFACDNHDKSSIPPSEDMNDTGDVSLTAQSTFQVGQPLYSAHPPSITNYASTSSMRNGPATVFTSSTSFGFVQANSSANPSVIPTLSAAAAAAASSSTNATSNGHVNGNSSNNSHQLPSHFILNNVAGTRQPLTTNFSSFV